jgi:peptidoglycan/xylan/chitin deacetylase (PgdA/CDA1 family)
MIMKKLLVIIAALALAAIFGIAACGRSTPSKPVPKPVAVTPLNNNCSGGYVAFTFDDGPSTYTQAMINELRALHMHAVFFVIGNRVQKNPQLVREEVADGFVVGDHTYNHRSFTGFGPKTPPLTGGQVVAELQAGSNAIVAAGAPKPTLYRPPYDDVTPHDNALAASLGLRLVMGYGNHATSGIVDSADWSGISTAQIASRVTQGYEINGFHMPGIHGGSIVIFHDGQPTAPNVIAALSQIVDYMNAHHLCSTSTVRADATGDVVPNNPTPAPLPASVPVPPAIGSVGEGG